MDQRHTIAFLPWLVLDNPITLCGVRFVPYIDDKRTVSIDLSGLAPILGAIMSGYVDIRGRPIENCTVVCISDRDPVWSIHEDDQWKIQQATALLTLATIAYNDYFSHTGANSNATRFQVFFQGFIEGRRDIAIQTRRREGTNVGGGYRHGDIKFSVPIQCRSLTLAKVDHDLIAGINKAQGSALLRRILGATIFFNLANTDADGMLPEAEIILSASAFDQLFNAPGSASKVSCALGKLFHSYGTVRVGDAQSEREGITTKSGNNEGKGSAQQAQQEETQKEGFLHRKWLKELYDLRSKLVHGEDIQKRTWGWSLGEHLVMAAFVFPLTVKLLLTQAGYYTLTDRDRAYCLAVDRLLCAHNWKDEPENGVSTWQTILSEHLKDEILKTPPISMAQIQACFNSQH